MIFSITIIIITIVIIPNILNTHIYVRGRSSGTGNPTDMHGSCVGWDTDEIRTEMTQDIGHR